MMIDDFIHNEYMLILHRAMLIMIEQRTAAPLFRTETFSIRLLQGRNAPEIKTLIKNVFPPRNAMF